jgi:hypothetical protein
MTIVKCNKLTKNPSKIEQGVCHTSALQKNNYGNSNISPCKNIIIKKKKKNPLKETKILQDIIITL